MLGPVSAITATLDEAATIHVLWSAADPSEGVGMRDFDVEYAMDGSALLPTWNGPRCPWRVESVGLGQAQVSVSALNSLQKSVHTPKCDAILLHLNA